ncbi:hypothetical protein A4X20_22600 [Mycolicibacterium iranicum]|uniref:Uncharacterized protein n=1 Tax=Mycolicibacterium iranicum TaxID=912594 RepID=A0A178LTE3_MYCIR|nr:hypothetical protein A4X20_22600 [Mycolicibacterium iranicum]
MRVPLMQSSRQPMAGLPRLRLRPGVWVRLRVMRWLPSVRVPLMQSNRPMVRLQRLSLMSLLPRWLRLMRMR